MPKPEAIALTIEGREVRISNPEKLFPTADARVSAPLNWEEVPTAELGDFTLRTVLARFAALGDPGAAIDERAQRLDGLLELSSRQEGQGQGDAPWPPHSEKQEGEPPRAQPSKRKKKTEP